jgi:hypothetical protein
VEEDNDGFSSSGGGKG